MQRSQETSISLSIRTSGRENTCFRSRVVQKVNKEFLPNASKVFLPPDNHKCRNVTYGCCCFANCYCNHRYLIEVDFSFDQFKSTKWKDKEYTINAPSFYSTSQKRKIDAPSFQHLLANGQLLVYVADAVSPSVRYL